MKEEFICSKNTILLVRNNEDKVLFGIKAVANQNFYDKLADKFSDIFSNAEEFKIHKYNFNTKKSKGEISVLINTGGGMMPYHIFHYKIKKLEII